MPRSVKAFAPLAPLAPLAPFAPFVCAALVAACSMSPHPAPVDLTASWTTWMGNAARAGYRGVTVPSDTPEVIWEASAGAGVRAAPVLTEEAVLIASTNRHLYAFNRQDGSLFWQRSVALVPGHPLVAGDRIYVATEGAREGEVRRLRFRDGATEWRRRLGSVGSPIEIADGELYGVTDRGVAFALRPHDGSELWRTPLPGHGMALGPVVAGDRVFVISGADSLYSLDRRTGHRLGAAPLPGGPAGLPALADDVVLVATTRGAVAAYGANGPAPLWQTGGFDSFAGGPVVAREGGEGGEGGGEAFAVTRSGDVVALRTADGTHRVVARLGAAVDAPPTLVSGGLLVGTLDGGLYFLDLNGRMIWKKELEGSITHPPAAGDGRIVVAMYGPAGGLLGSRPLRGKVVMLR